MSTPSAFLFDMDGLLLDTEQLFLEVAVELLIRRGYDPDAGRAFFLTLVGSSDSHAREKLEVLLGQVQHVDAFQADLFAAIDARMDVDVPLKPHVQDALSVLAGNGHLMAVVTSTRGAAARHHLSKADLIGHFAHVIGGDEVSANKPDPAPYLEAAAKLSVAPERCVAFEDSDRGATSAARAGCRVIQIPDLRPPDVELPDLGQHVATDLAAAMAHLGFSTPV
ncbi:HAD family hydrolase [Ruegeria hyattellae]|uniref:HAD family hydrolase n=1 Tax=Ruegeria hyattellae TaxID=3233337 RepID=UPI00355B5D1C